MGYTRTKSALLARLDDALRNMYHNATPDHPWRAVPDALQDNYLSTFNMWAECEIEYIVDGLGASGAEYAKERKRGWPHKGEREAWLVSCITQYGKLYTWGRGGRTIAPDGLIGQRGGSSFYIRAADNFADACNAELTHMIQVVEAFNNYVERWNSRENLTALWRDDCLNERNTLADCAKEAREALRKLARDARALAGVAGEAACAVLRREIATQRAHHKQLVQRIAAYNEALQGSK